MLTICSHFRKIALKSGIAAIQICTHWRQNNLKKAVLVDILPKKRYNIHAFFVSAKNGIKNYMLEGSEVGKISIDFFQKFGGFILFRKSIRRIVAALCVVMTTTAFSMASVSATEEPSDFGQYYGIVNANVLNVRASASEDAEIIASVSEGTYLKVNWMEPGWVNVAYNGDGLIGYVSDEYFTVYEGEMPELSATGGQKAVEIVKQYLGVPYVYGGTTPNGFDCSGLMQYVYKQLGYSINRVASAQMSNGVAVSRENLAPGDIIGFYSSPGSGYVGHVGMYVGNGMMIHAPRTGDVVKYTSIDSSYYASRYAGARRIIY